MKTKERFKAVQAAIAAIEKQFGKGAIMPLHGAKTQDVDVIPTGSLSLDLSYCSKRQSMYCAGLVSGIASQSSRVPAIATPASVKNPAQWPNMMAGSPAFPESYPAGRPLSGRTCWRTWPAGCWRETRHPSRTFLPPGPANRL